MEDGVDDDIHLCDDDIMGRALCMDRYVLPNRAAQPMASEHNDCYFFVHYIVDIPDADDGK